MTDIPLKTIKLPDQEWQRIISALAFQDPTIRKIYEQLGEQEQRQQQPQQQPQTQPQSQPNGKDATGSVGMGE